MKAFIMNLIYKLISVLTINKIKISCIVLSYNGEKFLFERLNSIINQVYKPYEIIFLDDASEDNSVKIAKEILSNSKIRYRIIKNKQNHGCGHQIKKGIELAKGDFVWFAEQDDYCNIEFLNYIKKMIEDENINLAYCKSIPVDNENKKLEYYYDKRDIKEENCCISGKKEVEEKLCVKNTIHNFSSVVFRKAALKDIHNYLDKYKVFYDWIMYVYVLKEGKICYCSDVINYHRRHVGSIIAKKRRSYYFYNDIFNVKEYIFEHFKIPESNQDEMLWQIERDYRQYGCEGYDSPSITDHPILGKKYFALQDKLNSIKYNNNK